LYEAVYALSSQKIQGIFAEKFLLIKDCWMTFKTQ
jgi:hypothetical protein